MWKRVGLGRWRYGGESDTGRVEVFRIFRAFKWYVFDDDDRFYAKGTTVELGDAKRIGVRRLCESRE